MMELNNSKFCLCGSGLLYKDCCQNKIDPTDTKMHKALMHDLEIARKKYRKICLHPLQNKCSPQKTNAHTISQKAVLDLIDENGHVYMPVMCGIFDRFDMKLFGIASDATTLYCFCTEHDSIFYPIDKPNVSIDSETSFLYAYRAFSGTYYKVLRENGVFLKLSEKYDFTKTPHIVLLHQFEKQWLKELDDCRKIFDDAILSHKFDIIKTHTIDLSYKVFFAVSSCFPVAFDLYGNQIETDIDKMQMVYISIIPDENRSKIVFSWLNRDFDVYKLLESQLNIVPKQFTLKYLNNLLPMNCENMTISPMLWESWSASARQEFLDAADCRKNELAKKEPCSYFSEKSYNLFENLEIKNIES